MTNVVVLRCWNHLINAIKAWLRKHDATSKEIPVYVSNVRELLNESDMRSYESRLMQLRCKWSKAFVEYYMQEIHPEVSQHTYMCCMHWIPLYYIIRFQRHLESLCWNLMVFIILFLV